MREVCGEQILVAEGKENIDFGIQRLSGCHDAHLSANI